MLSLVKEDVLHQCRTQLHHFVTQDELQDPLQLQSQRTGTAIWQNKTLQEFRLRYCVVYCTLCQHGVTKLC